MILSITLIAEITADQEATGNAASSSQESTVECNPQQLDPKYILAIVLFRASIATKSVTPLQVIQLEGHPSS